MIYRRSIVCLVALFWLASCVDREKVAMQNELLVLNDELQSSQLFVKTLEEVGSIMDSIDINRNILRANVAEGTSYTDYVSRMNELNDYVKSSRKKLQELEIALQNSNGRVNSYAASIKKLKSDLELKSQELLALEEVVNRVQSENSALIQTISSQEHAIVERNELIELKELQLSNIEKRVQELMTQARMDEAEAYFAQAAAIEEAANRTKFAPKKKKETQQRALELYRLALVFGKEEAEERIAYLEEKF